MIIDWSTQGSPEWLLARSGIPTASNFGMIMTPTGRASSQADGYMNSLVAEWLLGRPAQSKKYGRMELGNILESDARDMYEFITGHQPVEVGMVYKNAGRLVGCSPDGLLADIERGVEIKCPDEHVHAGYLIGERCPSAYLPQVQGSMYVTGYKEWDFVSYNPDLPPLIVTVKRDEEYIKSLDKYMKEFIQKMLAKRQKALKYKVA